MASGTVLNEELGCSKILLSYEAGTDGTECSASATNAHEVVSCHEYFWQHERLGSSVLQVAAAVTLLGIIFLIGP